MHVVCVVLQWWTRGPVDGIAVRGCDRSEGVRDMQTSTGGVSPPASARLRASLDETRSLILSYEWSVGWFEGTRIASRQLQPKAFFCHVWVRACRP